MGEFAHLARRFFASVRRGGPTEADRAWVEDVLSRSEYELWAAQYAPDRRHSASVARRVERELAGEAFGRRGRSPSAAASRELADEAFGQGAPAGEDTSWVLASALLHDIGKLESGLGTWGRVWATVAAKVLGAQRVAAWIDHDGCRGRAGRYVNHPEIGAELLRGARSDPRTVAWASQHHKPADSWTLPPEIAQVLHEFDND
ncbi:MAG: HD domain-containing protein [Acidimicrobiaceae bacterium]|nr:HD domain-containing protein [Acidimicrobiia bacterium]MCY4492259.1 HD domain-containing protein [Acidimicrobiaceae bacterium]